MDNIWLCKVMKIHQYEDCKDQEEEFAVLMELEEVKIIIMTIIMKIIIIFNSN